MRALSPPGSKVITDPVELGPDLLELDLELRGVGHARQPTSLELVSKTAESAVRLRVALSAGGQALVSKATAAQALVASLALAADQRLEQACRPQLEAEVDGAGPGEQQPDHPVRARRDAAVLGVPVRGVADRDPIAAARSHVDLHA